MSLALSLFLSLLSQDHALQSQLKKTQNIQSFVQVAVQLAEERGYQFDSQEIEALLNSEKGIGVNDNISDDILLAQVNFYTSNWDAPACQRTLTVECKNYLNRLGIDPYTSNFAASACSNTATQACKAFQNNVSNGCGRLNYPGRRNRRGCPPLCDPNADTCVWCT